jgi:PTH1 family peptidyl-tRNA hydrolase
VVERLCAARRLGFDREECRSLVAERDGVRFCQPQTYMNRSGWALRCLAERHGLEPAAILVVYDEVALPLGRMRARARGGAAGHRGMESVLENLRTEEVPRLRLGVGAAEGETRSPDLATYVLAPFLPAEAATVEELIARAAAAVEVWLEAGIEAVMNRFNA